MIAADTDGVIRRWDSECTDLLGYTSEEALGQRTDLIVPPVLRSRHWQGFNNAVRTGRLKRPGKTLKVLAVHKSGSLVPLQGSFELSRSDDGSVDQVILAQLAEGPSWLQATWRPLLALLKLGQTLRRRIGWT